jgi:hypothetical protein
MNNSSKNNNSGMRINQGKYGKLSIEALKKVK